jgi:putative ABC transport system permease protein
VQSILLVSLGGAAGVALAAASLPLLQQLSPNQGLAPFLNDLKLDGGTLGFAAVLVLGTGLLAGLLPALQARRTSFLEALRSDSRSATLGRDGLRWQQAMIVLQAGIAVLILTGAGLAGLGLMRLNRIDLGFRTENRAAIQLQFPEPAYAAPAKRVQFVHELELNLSREPAVRGFAFTATLPVGDGQWGGGFVPQRANGEFDPDPTVLHFRRVSPGYLKLMGTPLIEGRLLSEHDTPTSPNVAVISKSVAEKFWPGTTALGRKLRRSGQKDAPLVEVVGVVANVRDAGAAAVESDAIYMPWDQISMRRGWVVMEGADTAALLAAGRRALHTTAPDIAPYNPGTLEAFASRANALPRLQMAMLAVFAVIATGITALGSYGVMSQLVANREREMAVRAALGASSGMVLRMVLWQNARLAAAGTFLGLIGAWFGARALQSQLTGVDASVVWPYIAVAGVVLGLTQIASFIPARRASRLDVQKALAGV